jgi:hypothetical protein
VLAFREKIQGGVIVVFGLLTRVIGHERTGVRF